MLTKEFLSVPFSLRDQAKGTFQRDGGEGCRKPGLRSLRALDFWPSVHSEWFFTLPFSGGGTSYQSPTAGISVLRIYPKSKPTLRGLGLAIQVQGSKQVAERGEDLYTEEETEVRCVAG